jgi:butyrate kinase
MNLLVINPGSTSTKISYFADEEERHAQTLSHATEELARYDGIADQAPMRRAAIDRFLSEHEIDAGSLSAVVGRGGLLHPLEGGVYAVSDPMVRDLQSGRYGRHASNLGGVLARAIADEAGCPAYIADPVVVDELDDIARLSGHPQLPRKSIFHALNQKSSAREACRRRGIVYESSSLIVAHMGGGVSVGAHRNGRVVDVNNALDGEGPFSPERAGTVPAGQLVELALTGEYDRAALKKMLTGEGGMVAYCGTNDVRELIRRQDDGDEEAALVLRAMCFQIAKEIAAHGATLSGSVDAIVLTGGMAHNDVVIAEIGARVGYLGPIVVIPGEREMLSLASAALGALRGEREVREYE